MIAFDLQCDAGHIFEAWFKDRQAYEEQFNAGLLECPVCGSGNVKKILSPVAVKRSVNASSPPVPGEQPSGSTPPELFYRALTKLYQKVVETTEDVGTDFTSEALKIHYGVKEPRNIRGVATAEEEKMLQQEGVEFLKIPVPAEKKKKEDEEH